jgi:HEAT repeat protein
MEILAHTGRTKESFLAAVARTNVEKAADLSAHERLKAAEARAVKLEGKASAKQAIRGLEDEDVVVRARALEALADKAPEEVVERANDLLRVPNDPFRYLVCQAIAKTGDARAAAALEALVEDPVDSLNPNVLRIRAVQALAACGDAGSVKVIAPHAASGVYFNGLTGIAVDALAAIAKRDKKARDDVQKVLRGAYPKPPSSEDARAMRACVALARRIHRALGEKREFPEIYDDEARVRLMEEPK